MHLKRLKVRNFKSFAGAVDIPFQPGFTGIAGPNGMGKSNISDAILFVLGPTSSKALRADRLTHLFFNGGSSKKPATECEVSLIFDNRDRLLPSESDEVEVTRYVKLTPSDPDGYYSYFYINGRRTTQGEIDSLLSHARLSGDGYNLVQQGDVNRIVSMGPIPRRALVERLAGISQYDEELERASVKRTDLETNLTQIHTLLGEIRSHLGALESQRLQAIRFKELQEQKRQAEGRLARADLKLAEHEVESCQHALEKLAGEIQELEATATRLESERDRIAAGIDAAEKEIAARAGPDGIRFKNELDEKRLAVTRLHDQFQAAEDAAGELGQRVQNLESATRDLDSSLTTLVAEEKKLAAALAAAESKGAAEAKALDEATSHAERSQGKLAELRKQVLIAEQAVETEQGSWQSAVQALEASRAALSGCEREQASAEDDERTRELELKDLELRVRQGASGTAKGERPTPELQTELFKLKARSKTLGEEGKSLSSEVLELNRRYLALDARLKVRADSGPRAGSQAAVDFLLAQRNLGKLPGIRGTVEELSRFDAAHHTALTVAAGSRFQSLVVETDQVAEECIKLLRAEKRGRATFLPLNKMLPGRPRGKSMVSANSPGAVGFAVDLVKFDEELRPAFWYVFGETVVMKDLAQAREQMGGVRLVTLAGELIEATGAITGGFIETGDRARGGDNAVELRRLGEELREKSARESAVQAELSEIEARIRTLSEELAKRTGEEQAHGTAVKLLEKELASARERLSEARSRVQAATKAQAHAAAELANKERSAKSAEDELAAARNRLTELQSQYHDALPGSISGKIRSLQDNAAAAAQEKLEAAKALEAVRAQLKAARDSRADREKELTEAKSLLAAKTKERAQLSKSRAAMDEELEKLTRLEAEQLKAVQSQTEEKKRLETQRLKLVENLATAHETLRTRRVMDQNQRIQLATAEQKLSQVREAAAPFAEMPDEGPPVPAEELRRSIATLASQLASLGDVNQRALEEYDSEKARLDQFEGEVGRLTAEKTELTGLVGEIEKKKRARLTEVVAAVNEGYRTIYSELSSGGEGEIRLENPEDPLAGGLLIQARPVGKVIQRLEQLSGGEKSLASLAFVFALQRYDPSPLYVFDEVDMSLDGVNAENVGRMLRRNSERAQFIVISLRKVTLKFAHRLYGVTMHGDGCSRVVGLKIDEVVDLEERDRAATAPASSAPAAAAAPEVSP
jgi:chromosome segregation protein